MGVRGGGMSGSCGSIDLSAIFFAKTTLGPKTLLKPELPGLSVASKARDPYS